MKRIIIVFLSVLLSISGVRADEGMWLPMFLKSMNFKEMQEKGLKLTPEQIYSVNNSSLKDAIVGLGRPGWNGAFNFCTGEIISKEGLFLTNHHCGYGAIQQLSTDEENYLEEGFWAMERKEEKPAGFVVHILQRMEDVTDAVLEDIDHTTAEAERAKLIASRIDSIKKEAEGDSHYKAIVKPFYKGNEYYMFIYEVFSDVRFVGAPPSSIGKYGGDTDNWMWPRHTGDFSMFRIYADKDNKPAAYSEDNVPYKPKHHLPVSLKGVEKEDYAMIFGFPGSTDRFLTSYGVKLATDKDQPARVKIRRKKLDMYEEKMNTDPSVKLKYASKHSGVSNYWKYFKGQTAGLKRLNVYEQKKKQEEAFRDWVSKDKKRKEKYDSVFTIYENAYETLNKYQLSRIFLTEAIFGIEIIGFSRSFGSLKAVLQKKDAPEEAVIKMTEALRAQAKDYFKDYVQSIDKNVMREMLKMYYEELPVELQSPWFREYVEKNKGDFQRIADKVFDKSILASEERVMDFLDKPKAKKLEKDPAIMIADKLLEHYRNNHQGPLRMANKSMEKAQRLYVDGLRKMNPDKKFAPDANSTMRVTYGQVLDYFPRDAVYYNFYTTLDGVMEKEDPRSQEFKVHPKLKELWKAKDYGRYGKDGELTVCFISNNDITGGNSGSPVINGKGELIGTAFDGNWEAMSGDIAFEPDLQRTISVDIRYTLFIVDKFAGAGHLIEEMTIVE